MFDRAIIETDNFLNISMSAKALYFLLGMEADDEGFVSPNRVIRLYGGEIGDIKNLIDVGLVIRFESGVLVITDWNQNNYLDKNRIKPTQYQKEKKTITLTDGGKYVFNNSLTLVQPEEYRGVENSRVEKRIETPLKNKLEYLSHLPDEDIKELTTRFDASPKGVKDKAESLMLYCQSKNKRYSNYKAFLLNAIKRDFKERPKVVQKVQEKEIEMTKEQKEAIAIEMEKIRSSMKIK